MRRCLFPVLAAVLAGCGGPAYRLVPAEADARIVQIEGRDYVWAEREGVAVAAAFEGRRGKHLIFRLVLSNTSKTPVKFDPVRADCRPEGADAPVPGVDPRKMVAEVDGAMRSEKASREGDRSYNAFTDLVDLVDTFAKPGRDQSLDEARRESERQRSADEQRAEAERSHRQRLAMLECARKYWKEEALHASMVAAGGKAQGTIHFQTGVLADSVALRVRVGGREFGYRFVRPEPPAR
ncbi:MAG: putative periplasmic lipoprotein [Planctomycetota bacterium]|jgi:hypothetical protein